METKKTQKANLEKTKTLFLTLGLIIAVSILITAFSFKSEKLTEVFYGSTGGEPEPINIQKTVIPEPPPPEENKKQVNTLITDVLILTVDTSKTVSTEIFFPDDTIFFQEPIEEPTDGILDFASKMPIFPGGITALMRYITNNVDYSSRARENGIQGTVYLRFEVTKTGHIGKVELQKGIDELIDNAAIDVVKKLPKFEPGMHNGQAVNVWFSIPISFKIKTD
jgi:protein TonB